MEQNDFFDILGKMEETQDKQPDAASEKEKETASLIEQKPSADGPDAAAAEDDAVKKEEPNFEEAIKELEKVVADLQRSDLSLDKSMELFQKGTLLLSYCRKHLDDAEQQVKILLEKASGETETQDFLGRGDE